jgi:ribonuclease J
VSDVLRLIPLGGLGEVGKNMLVVEYDRQILVIDAGLMFPENDMLGIDLVIPDYGYLLDRKEQVQAIVLTHGHEDHVGALPYLLREIVAPIYATRLTRGLAEIKLRRHHLLDRTELHTVQDGDRLTIGAFEIEFFRVTHSIPDCVGLVLDTPVGRIVHSGDFKFDYTPVDGRPTDFSRLASIGGRGVLALCSDSTNAINPGFTPSEQVVEQAFEAVFREAQGRIIVGTFASLISRIQQVLNCAHHYGRKVAIAGRAISDNVAIARGLGYIDIPPETLISLDQSQHLPPREVVILATGTQGEPAAALARMATGRHWMIEIQEQDTVIMSAQIIPGNEELVHRTINRLYQRGARVVYDELAPVHVSGHASQEEQKLLIHLIHPKYLVPIHGELRHLHAHARLAAEMGMPRENILLVENGYVLEFTPEQATIGERVPGGYVFVDGTGIGDVGPSLMREREQLARDGFVVVVMPRKAGARLAGTRTVDGEPTAAPRIVTQGLVYQPHAADLLDGISARAQEVLDKHRSMDDADLEEALRRSLEDYIYTETKRRPVVSALLSPFT